MSLEIISEVEPQVGQYYMVPCVFARKRWWPVMGGMHTDVEIGFAVEHFHFDWRFAYQSQLFYGVKKRDYGIEMNLGRVQSVRFLRNEGHEKPVMRMRRMLREMPDFPLNAPGISGKSYNAAKLEQIYAGQKLKCLICPHRGFSLKGMPVKNGMVICPGHGLKWNIKTGEMVPR